MIVNLSKRLKNGRNQVALSFLKNYFCYNMRLLTPDRAFLYLCFKNNIHAAYLKPIANYYSKDVQGMKVRIYTQISVVFIILW